MYNQKVTVLVNHCHTVSIAKTLQLANTGYSSLYTINNCIINCTKHYEKHVFQVSILAFT